MKTQAPAFSTSVHGIAFDQKQGFHRIQASVDDGSHKFNGYFYIQTENEILAVEKGIELAKEYFLGNTKSIKLTAAELTAPVQGAHNGDNKENSIKEQQASSESEKPVSKKTSSSKSSSKSKKQVSPAKEEEMESVPSPFSAPVEEPKKEEAPKKSVYTLYNRNEKLHTAALSSFLTAVSGSEAWKKKPGVSEFSIGMVGKDFLDKEGDFAPSFKEACYKFLGVTPDGL